MAEFIELLETHAGEPDEGRLDDSVVDVLFEQLGYDSVALLEVLSQIRHQYGIDLAEEILADMKTPRQALHTINELINA
ncbi:hypothetical protein GCM10009560_53860 [Nonomuraea longicatena]|uniref:Carrier domain-containing protein n=1 Tax=Nonomuraea longicatena TaxID=83682 RepID=A0ABN1QG48_9ACTN